MSVAVGIDVAKQTHWAEVKVAETGKVLLSRAVDNTPAEPDGAAERSQDAVDEVAADS